MSKKTVNTDAQPAANQPPRVKRKYVRKTLEQSLQELEAEQARALKRKDKALQKLESERARLLCTPSSRKVRMQMQLQFQAATARMVPDWDERHFMAAICRAIEEDPETLKNEGSDLLEKNGSNRKGAPRRLGTVS